MSMSLSVIYLRLCLPNDHFFSIFTMSDLIEQRSAIKFCLRNDQHVNKVKELVLKSRRLTVKDLTNMIGISEGSVKNLGLRKVKSRLVPKTLNFLEKSRRVNVRETMPSDYQDYTLLREGILVLSIRL